MKKGGFTLVEIIVVVVVVAILSTIVVARYNGSQERAARSLVYSNIDRAASVMETYQVPSSDYPPNLAGTDYVQSDGVSVALFTDAQQVRSYAPGSLNADQNAQLFLFACNAAMPIQETGNTYNTGCQYQASKKLHVTGQQGSNVIIEGPTINQADFVLTCGSVCTTAQQKIISDFIAQGGTFPITVPSKSVSLPAPTLSTYTDATRYCLEVGSIKFPNVIYYATSESNTPIAGPCPNDPELHYPWFDNTRLLYASQQ